MSDPAALRVLLGYDGSPAANAAIDAGARLFPGAHATLAYVWTPPFASDEMRNRLWAGAKNIDAFRAAVEREGSREATRLISTGIHLARAAGWDAEARLEAAYGGNGLELAQLAEELDADLVVVGSRGLGGTRAFLGSVSDVVVHYAPGPALVIPQPLLSAEYDALTDGPVVVGWDGSTGAAEALAAARTIFPSRQFVLVSVGEVDADAPELPGDADVTTLALPGRIGPQGRVVAEALSEAARAAGAAVIVVGSRGRSTVREMFLGSVAMATLHHAHRPVLVAAHRTTG
ncbi:universal stress protein [Cryptosporangium arvum]|uniref:Universal stress protein UspA-like protein n=1 Tax=Cryptosporangium arvum DSM 44712 TaxID=927661 RepID=A0A011AKH7_9ACTN|nr:universal stress protein [Cryptosporangium arvum]EXG82476.1 universal stress protein UspA-like protein [Cryptosporangium arvum DSM 44712]